MNVFKVILTDEKGVIHDTLIETDDVHSAIDQSLDSHIDWTFNSHKNASRKECFDYKIKKSFEHGDAIMPGTYLSQGLSFGRKIKERIYDRYLDISLDKTYELIDEEIVNRYEKGSMGHEISTGKFYSVASSSRFALSSFCKKQDGIIRKAERIGDVDISNLDFEVGLPITDVSEPQMDVSLDANNAHYFIEAKCHEIFDTSAHRKIELSVAYKDALKKLLGIDIENNPSETISKTRTVWGKKKEVKIFGKGGNALTPIDFGLTMKTYHFDVKQFLCHLMGILSSEQYKAGQHINFFYLFYKDEEFSKIYEELEKEMEIVAEKFMYVLEDQISFGCIYNTKFDTLESFSPYRIFNKKEVES